LSADELPTSGSEKKSIRAIATSIGARHTVPNIVAKSSPKRSPKSKLGYKTFMVVILRGIVVTAKTFEL